MRPLGGLLEFVDLERGPGAARNSGSSSSSCFGTGAGCATAAATWPASWMWSPPWWRAALIAGAIRRLLPASSSLSPGVKGRFGAMEADASVRGELEWEWGMLNCVFSSCIYLCILLYCTPLTMHEQAHCMLIYKHLRTLC
jgi:hypothetical protein